MTLGRGGDPRYDHSSNLGGARSPSIRCYSTAPLFPSIADGAIGTANTADMYVGAIAEGAWPIGDTQ